MYNVNGMDQTWTLQNDYIFIVVGPMATVLIVSEISFHYSLE